MAGATELTTPSGKISGFVGRYRYLIWMSFGHSSIDVQTLYQKAVWDVVRDERQCYGLTLLYRDFGRRERKALGMNLNRLLLADCGSSRYCDNKQRRDKCGNN